MMNKKAGLNYLNVFASILAFLVGAGLLFGLWNPINDMIEYFPTGLKLFCQLAFVIVCFMVIFAVPISSAIADDKGSG